MIRLLFSIFFSGSSLPWIIGAVLAAVGGFYGWLAFHDNEVWNKATAAFNQMQQEVYQKKEEEFKQQTETIDQNAGDINKAMAERNQETLDQLKTIEQKAMTESNPDKKEASPYLKSIVKELNLQYGKVK